MATAAKKAPLIIELGTDKDTPNTRRFKEDERPKEARPFIGTVYITDEGLALLGTTKPERIRITVEAIG